MPPCGVGCVFAVVFALGGCTARPTVRVDAVDVRLVAQDTSWHASYVISRGAAPTEVPTGREVHVPLGADVRLALDAAATTSAISGCRSSGSAISPRRICRPSFAFARTVRAAKTCVATSSAGCRTPTGRAAR